MYSNRTISALLLQLNFKRIIGKNEKNCWKEKQNRPLPMQDTFFQAEFIRS